MLEAIVDPRVSVHMRIQDNREWAVTTLNVSGFNYMTSARKTGTKHVPIINQSETNQKPIKNQAESN